MPFLHNHEDHYPETCRATSLSFLIVSADEGPRTPEEEAVWAPPEGADVLLVDEDKDVIYVEAGQDWAELAEGHKGAAVQLVIHQGARKTDILRLLRKILVHFDAVDAKADEAMDWYVLKHTALRGLESLTGRISTNS